MTASLTLFVPGLLGPWPTASEPGFPLPATPALERLLARADAASCPVAGFEAVLCLRFGLQQPPDGDLPVAALTRLADTGAAAGHWLRADPVHLRADLHQVLLVDARHLAITADEAARLAEAFNCTFADDGLRLDTPCPERWYLQVDPPPALRTTPLADTIGRDIDPRLPQGDDARRWHARLTEIQMLFHAHPVNQLREAREQPTLNGLWLWGGGGLPDTLQAPRTEFYARDPLSRGLARQAGLAVQVPPDDAGDWRAAEAAGGDALIVLDELRDPLLDDDPSGWSERLAGLERRWFAPLLEMLRRGHLRRLALLPCDGRRFTLVRAGLRRFWRRSRPLVGYLH